MSAGISSIEATTPTNASLPDKWSCDGPTKKVKVEIELGYDGNWVEIPTNKVETYASKGEASSIQRAAKVRFPTEWGGRSVRNLIKQFQPEADESGLMHCRIAYRRQNDIGDYIYTHYGWVGGVGSASEMDSKFWVYDFAELLGGIPVTETFNKPKLGDAIRKVTNLSADAGIPIEETLVKPPESEEEFAEISDVETPDPSIAGAGILVDEVVGISGVTYGTDQAVQRLQSGDIPITELRIDFLEEEEVGTKSFRRNRNTLIEIYEWMEKETNGELYFEATDGGEGVRLVFDIVPNRRRYGQTEVIDETDVAYHETVTVLDNEALTETVPMNTLYLKGEVGSGRLSVSDVLFGGAYEMILESEPPSEKFPVAKVQSEPLLQAANGNVLAPTPIESAATTEEEIAKEAGKEMRDRLSQVSEGHIEIKGIPPIRPYDRLDAFETCNSFVEETENPVVYEIEEVKHTATATDIYKTRCRVSIWTPDDDITVEVSMEPIEGR